MIYDENQSNYETFLDCVSGPFIQRLLSTPANPMKKKSAKSRKNAAKSAVPVEEEVNKEAEDLADFLDVQESFSHNNNH